MGLIVWGESAAMVESKKSCPLEWVLPPHGDFTLLNFSHTCTREHKRRYRAEYRYDMIVVVLVPVRVRDESGIRSSVEPTFLFVEMIF